MNNYVKKVLIDSGWYIDRKIDFFEINSFWKENYGYSFIKATNFFEEFGDLELKIKKYNKYNCIINTSPKSRILSPYVIECCNDYLNTRLLPIGFIYGDNAFLLINENGELFQYIDEYICKCNNDFPNLVFDFINGKTDDLIWDEIEDF